MRRLLATLGMGVACIAACRANGAMGLALELWDPTNWVFYVGATVALEAWLIGRWLKFGWAKSVGVSVLANAFTGIRRGLGRWLPVQNTYFLPQGNRIRSSCVTIDVAGQIMSALAFLCLKHTKPKDSKPWHLPRASFKSWIASVSSLPLPSSAMRFLSL